MKCILSILFIAIFLSCSSSSSPSSDVNKLESDIVNLSKSLEKRPTIKKAQTLKELYAQANKKDLAKVEQLKQSNAPDKWVQIYNIYDRMQIRQIAVIPVNPTTIDGKTYTFDSPNIDKLYTEAKNNASSQLYEQASMLLQTGNTLDARKAYSILEKLTEFNYSYKDAKERKEAAKIQGSTNVFVAMNNQTGKRLPASFEDDLLSFRQAGFTNEWIIYHHKRDVSLQYDYFVDVNVKELTVGRNDRKQRQFREENRIIVGYQQGKDSNGNTVRVPQYAMVYADVLETIQFKPITIIGEAVYKDKKKETLATLPLQIEEAWQNNFAQFRGDERALSQETIEKIRNGEQPYPEDEQFYELSGKLLNQAVENLFEQNAKNLE